MGEITSKPWYKSRTVWFAALTILIGAAGLVGFAEWQPDAQTSQLITLVVGVVAIILRALTNRGITI